MTYNPDEIDRLVREGREDDERMKLNVTDEDADWSARQDAFDRNAPWFIYATLQIVARVGDPHWEGGQRAAGIARTRNNLPAMVAALSAAKAEVERLTAGCTACRLENEANAEENDRLAAELQALKEEHTDLCEQRQKWLPKALDADRLAAEVERLTKERDKARSRVLRPLTEDEVVAALHEGRAERRVAEGDNAWTSLVNQRDRLSARVRELESQQPACGERSPVPWFTACVRKYPHDGQHEHRPLQSLYDKQRCEACGSDSKVWDELTARVRELEHAIQHANSQVASKLELTDAENTLLVEALGVLSRAGLYATCALLDRLVKGGR